MLPCYFIPRYPFHLMPLNEYLKLSNILVENRKPVERLLVWLANLGSRCAAVVKRKHLTYIFMVLNNPEVLIKMKADTGMKDPPTLAVFNVQDIPLKGEHFLRSGAFILIAYRKMGEGGETKWPSAALQLASSSRVLWDGLTVRVMHTRTWVQ